MMQDAILFRQLVRSTSPEILQQAITTLSDNQADVLLHDWWIFARDNQLIPEGDWQTWLILAGRGFGKTRTGAECVREWVKSFRFVNLIGATADDARDIMIEGESGILGICPKSERPLYRKSERKLEWPSGAVSLIFTADEPERLRGKQHEKIWADELCSWRRPESWDQAMFGLRLGVNPQAVVTTTPKPTKLLKEIIASSSTFVTRGNTYDNQANLAPSFFSHIIKKYEGSRLGRQELNAEVLDDNPGALWKRQWLDDLRVMKHPDLERIVVAMDPSASNNEESDETGIITAGTAKDHGYLIDDTSIRGTPNERAKAAITAYHKHKADSIVVEVNNGGDWIEATIKTIDPNVPVKMLHASRGKHTRAEPVASLYEQKRVHHVGAYPELEDQFCEWMPGDDSPDRLDAAVWAFTELMLETFAEPRIRTL